MSIESELPPSAHRNVFEQSLASDSAAQALNETQESNVEQDDGRREERFLWIVACVILFDCAFLLNADNFAGPIIIGLFQLVVIVVIAKRLGVQEIVALIYNLIDKMGKAKGEN